MEKKRNVRATISKRRGLNGWDAARLYGSVSPPTEASLFVREESLFSPMLSLTRPTEVRQRSERSLLFCQEAEEGFGFFSSTFFSRLVASACARQRGKLSPRAFESPSCCLHPLRNAHAQNNKRVNNETLLHGR